MQGSKLNTILLTVINDQRTIKVGLIIVLILAIIMKLQFLAIVALILAILLFNPDLGNLIRQHVKAVKLGDKEVQFRPLDDVEPVSDKEVLKDTEIDQTVKDLLEQGNKFLFADRPIEAVDKYKEAIKIDNRFSDAYLNLGAAYLRLWHQSKEQVHLLKSIENSKRALDLDAGGYRSRINLAVAYSKLRRHEVDALRLYEEADQKGDLQDPLTWGKVKLFKGEMILRLSERADSSTYQKQLPEAEYSVLRSIDLFKEVGRYLEVIPLIRKAESVLELIRKKIQSSNLSLNKNDDTSYEQQI